MVVKGKGGKFNSAIPVCYAVTCMLTAAFFESRSFFLGSVAALVVLYITTGKYSTWFRGLILFLSVALALAVSIAVKSDSSLGRLLIYKISFGMLADHPWLGIGIGNFKRDYLLYQAAYFEKGDFTTKELLLADNTHVAFNDYLQLWIEGGIPTFILLTLYVMAIVCLVHATLKQHATKPLSAIAAVNIIVLSIAALFTYVFNNPFWTAMMLLSILVLVYPLLNVRNTKPELIRILMMYVTVGAFFLTATVSYYYKRQQREGYLKASTLASAGYKQDALEQYQKYYSVLMDAPWAIYGYGRFLMSLNETHQAIEHIELSTQSFSINNQYLDLADCFASLHDNDRAEWHYLKSIHMVPNRFQNRYKLFKFYVANGKETEAYECAKSIADLPVKVLSQRVIFIKEEVNKYLESQAITNP